MKNFRKVLALILVVATLFSFTAMASAASYKDADKISADYTEAVDVLSTIGILNGYTDETFQPAKNIQREEMAKMVAVLSNAGDDISSLYASACTFADSKNSWAASYIAYCNQTGIVAGRSATTFDPDANVTGIETAKMLLCVLGFDAAEQGYVGSNWKINVLRDAKNFGLLDGFAADYDVAKAITREEAAQMFLNALKAPIVVGTVSSNIVKVSNSLFYEKGFKLTLIDAEKEGYVLVYGNVLVSPKPLGAIYKGLALDPAQDCYGRPGYKWTYTNPKTAKTTFIGFYVNAADKTYTTYADLATDYGSELKATGVYAYTFRFYADGTPVATTAADFAKDYTGNGTLTEVFVDTATRVITVTAKTTYFAKVTATSTYYDTFTLSDVNGNVIGTFAQTSNKVAAGDYVLFYLCNGSKNSHASANKYEGQKGTLILHDVEVVEPVTATVSYGRSYNGSLNKSYFVADKTYSYNVNFANMFNGKVRREASPILDDSYNTKSVDIYTDAYGNAMYVTLHKTSLKENVAFFEEKTGWAEFNGYYLDGGVKKESWTYTADAVVYGDTDGVVEPANMTIDATLFKNLDDRTTHESVGILAKYTVSSNGTFTKTAHADFMPAGAQLSKASRVILNGELYADSDTKFLIRTTNVADGSWKYELITGYQNLPATYVAQPVRSAAYPNHTSIQYFARANEAKMCDYVFIDAAYSPSYSQFLVMGKEYTAFWAGIAGIHANDYVAYRALVDGVDSLVLIDKSQTLATGYMYDFGLTYIGTSMAEDADKNGNKELPLYVSASEKTPAASNKYECKMFDIYVDSKGDVQVKVWNDDATKDYILLKGADTVKVFHVRAADAFNNYQGYWVEENTISTELVEDAQRLYVVTDASGVVTALYIVELAPAEV